MRPARPHWGTKLPSTPLMEWHFSAHICPFSAPSQRHILLAPPELSVRVTLSQLQLRVLTALRSNITIPNWQSLKRASIWPSPATGWFPSDIVHQLGRALRLQQGALWDGHQGSEGWLSLCVPTPGRAVLAAFSAVAATPSLLLQGYQDHSLLALQFTFELMSVLLGIRLSGHWLHSLGLRWRGKQVSHSLPPGAIIPGTKTPRKESYCHHAAKTTLLPRNH